MSVFKVVEKKNHKAVHGIFETYDRADNHLNNVIPDYVARSYFTDKTLTAESFEIIESLGE